MTLRVAVSTFLKLSFSVFFLTMFLEDCLPGAIYCKASLSAIILSKLFAA